MAISIAFLISQIILLISYLMTSMLSLRAIVCVAQIGFMAAALMFGLDQPGMLSTFIFAVLIFGINIVHMYRLLYVKLPASIPDLLKNVYQQEFQQFSPREFLLLMDYAEYRFITNGYIIKENTIADVSMILDGAAEVLMGPNKITELEQNSIIGEISFLTNNPSIASVKADNTVNFCTWTRENLTKLKSQYPKIYYKFFVHLISCVANKLKNQNLRSFL